MGEKIGLQVLKGWETFTDGPEYLTYGLDKEFLLQESGAVARLPKEEYLARVHAAGGFVSHAHPFSQGELFADLYARSPGIGRGGGL